MTGQGASVRDAWLTTEVRRPSAPVMPKLRVLCATDLSRHSQRVVTRAAVISDHLDAELTLLHAGDDVATIGAVAKQTGAGLIVLGSQRREPLVSLSAATAGQIASRVQRPVLIVRRDSRAPYASVLIAAEQSAGFDQVLHTAASLRLLESESVAIIHGSESPYRGPLYASGFELHAAKRNVEEWELAARRRLLLNLEATGVESENFRLLFAQSRPIREIQRQVRKMGPDLLVMATKDHPALDRVMRAGAGNDALRNIECDILVVPQRERAGGGDQASP